MPTMMTVAQVKSLGVDMPVQGIKGQVTKIDRRFAGKRKDGTDYSLQKIKIRDGTGEITCILDGRDPADPAWAGQTVWISGHHGQKGWSGLKTKDDTYKDKSEFVLKVYSGAEITTADPDAQAAAPEAPEDDGGLGPVKAPGLTDGQMKLFAAMVASGVPQDVAMATAIKMAPAAGLPKTPQDAPGQVPATGTLPAKQDAPTGQPVRHAEVCGAVAPNGGQLGQAKVAALQASVLYVVAIDAAVWVKAVSEAKHAADGYIMPMEQFQALCSSLFIYLDRGGWAARMPAPPKEWIAAVEAAKAQQQQ